LELETCIVVKNIDNEIFVSLFIGLIWTHLLGCRLSSKEIYTIPLGFSWY